MSTFTEGSGHLFQTHLACYYGQACAGSTGEGWSGLFDALKP